MTIRFDEVAAVLELGPGRFSITAVNGDWLRVDTNMLLWGRKLEQQIRRNIARDLFVAYEPRVGGSVVDLSRQKLGFRTRVSKEIELLPSRLEPGEQVLTLAIAVHKRQSGLLVLTTRRVLHLSRAKTAKPRTIDVELAEVAGVRRGRLELLVRTLAV